MNQTEQQNFLLSTFREEVDGHIVNLTRALVDLEEGEEGPKQAELMRELMRILHTIKGASRMMGFPNISKVAHAMEDVIGLYREKGNNSFPREVTDLLFDGSDTIAEMVREITTPPNGAAHPINPLLSADNLAGLIFKLNTQAQHTVPMEDLLKSLSGTSKDATTLINSTTPFENSSLESQGLAAEKESLLPSFSSNPPAKNSGSPNGNVHEEPVIEKVERQDQAAAGLASTESSIRVRLDKLDGLINLAGELVLNKIQNEEHLQAIQEIVQLSRQRNRLASYLREFLIEQTPVEERSTLLGLTELFSFEQAQLPSWMLPTQAQANVNSYDTERANFKTVQRSFTGITKRETGLDAGAIRKIFNKLEEMIGVGDQIEQNLTKMVRDRKNYNLRFGSNADELRRNMLGIRMLPLDTIFNRYTRPIRDLANERGKQVKLLVAGGAIEVDKRILEEITDPLMHMLRNSVDHGIENTPTRLARGKSEEGTIRLSATQKGSHVLIQIEDDGAGIDLNKIRTVAATRGVFSEEDAAALTDEAALDLIFLPGFSTHAKADEISGRGIGMDVVQQNIKRLNGRVSVQTKLGSSTTFVMEIPLTLATMDALLLEVAGQIFAIPSVMVDGTIYKSREDLQKVEGREVLRLRDQFVPLVKLSDVLSIAAKPEEANAKNKIKDNNFFYGVLVSAGIGGTSDTNQTSAIERYICLEVDDLVDEREVVVKALGGFLEKTPIIAGASVLGANSLALILDVFGLVQSARQVGSTPMASFTPPNASTEVFLTKRTRRILVVDDSLATRELERSILETAGYKVYTARDGVEGLKMARELKPDLVLSDVEMPNMNGFQLCSAIKQDQNLFELPVIIVSSRDSEEDRRKGLQAGAQAYIIKGQFEQNRLLETINRLTL